MKNLSNYDLLSLLVGSAQAKVLAAKPLSEVFGYSKPRQTKLCVCESPETYMTPQIAASKELLSRCMREQLENDDVTLTTADKVKTFLCTEIGHLEYESFWVLFTNTKFNLIAAEELFRGTIDSTAVYPREVVKRAMQLNAANVLLAHNHPSGSETPSPADINLTERLKHALALVDVRVLDHLIITNNKAHSLAEKGLL